MRGEISPLLRKVLISKGGLYRWLKIEEPYGQKHFKKQAAERAVEEISPGMIIGLGSGSTLQFAIERSPRS